MDDSFETSFFSGPMFEHDTEGNRMEAKKIEPEEEEELDEDDDVDEELRLVKPEKPIEELHKGEETKKISKKNQFI